MKRIGLEEIIRARLKLQSIQRGLDEKFNIKDPSFSYITTPSFIKRFKNWDQNKRKDFVYMLVGPSKENMWKTFKCFEKLMVVYNAAETNTKNS